MTELNSMESHMTVDHSKKHDKVIIMLDMSKLDLFQLCNFRYYCRHIMLRDLPILKKARALDDGAIAHKGLEVYFEGIAKGLNFPQRMALAIDKMKEVGADPSLSNSEPEDLSIVINAVTESCEYWRHEDEHLVIHAVENPFAFVLYEDEFLQIILSGQIDLLADKNGLHSREASYKSLPYDHKTFSRSSELFRLSNQFMNYCVATNSLFIRINKIGLQKTLKPEEKYIRTTLSYDRELLTEWKQNITDVIIDEYVSCMKTGKWKQNFTSCSKFNRLCEYYKVCESPGADNKARLLALDYVQGEVWDVTTKFTKNR